MNNQRDVFRRCALIAILLISSVVAVMNETAGAQTIATGRILFVREGSIWVWSDGQTSKLLEDGAASDPRWAPDGNRVLFVRTGNSYSDLIVLNLADGSQTQLTFHRPEYEEGTPDYVFASSWVADPDWSTSGIIGYLSDNGSPDGAFQVWLMNGPDGGGYLAPAAQVEDNLDSLSLSSGGSLAAYVEQNRQLDGTSLNRAILRDLSDGVAYPLANSNAFDPAIAPDEQTVAFAVRSKDDMTDIFVVSRASGDLNRVTRNLAASNPVWSPDGKSIAFVRMVNFAFEVWVVPIDGDDPGKPEKLFSVEDFDAISGLSWTLTSG